MVTKEEYGHPAYQVGDVVRVVDTPYWECLFTWAGHMDRYCGCEYTVREVCYSWNKQTYKYCLEGNGDNTLDNILWCSGCLVPVVEEFSEPSPSELTAWIDALLLP